MTVRNNRTTDCSEGCAAYWAAQHVTACHRLRNTSSQHHWMGLTIIIIQMLIFILLVFTLFHYFWVLNLCIIFWCFGKTVLETFMPIKPLNWKKKQNWVHREYMQNTQNIPRIDPKYTQSTQSTPRVYTKSSLEGRPHPVSSLWLKQWVKLKRSTVSPPPPPAMLLLSEWSFSRFPHKRKHFTHTFTHTYLYFVSSFWCFMHKLKNVDKNRKVIQRLNWCVRTEPTEPSHIQTPANTNML